MATRTRYNSLAITNPDELTYGVAPKPFTTNSGIVIGGGQVIPELNFTLPPMAVNDDTIAKANGIYKEMIDGVLKRAAELGQKEVVVEFETVPDYTLNPKYGLEATKILLDAEREAEAKYGMKAALRFTPNDTREMSRPPKMRDGQYYDDMMYFFEEAAKMGPDWISIESTGGKELNDEGLVNADIRRVIFALGACACNDMEFLWGKVADICKGTNMAVGGDSSCGFANTAMVLAEKGFIPRTFAAVVRVATVPRALVAYEMGAVAPSKDCEYAGPYIKAITGAPIAMEGRMASGAHLSQIGNIAAYPADLWSNESIQQVRLLSDMAPIVGMEQLVFDCRMLNKATDMGQKKLMRDIMIESDAPLDVQGYVLKPEVVLEISKEIVKYEDDFMRTKVAAAKTVEVLSKAIEDGKVACGDRDAAWLDMMADAIDEIPDDRMEFYEEMKEELDEDKYIPANYDLV
ncbi:Methanol:corrinoid methyltransferase [Lachnospiraceae bacterium TWA4]|nr:Methanol:corrinoid methyltransferase [Lachnospiraceae bacterium TWA4]